MNSMGFIKQIDNNQAIKNTIVPLEFTHSCAIGQTGCGKTSSYIYPNIEDRIKNNHSLIVYDYKGKEHTSVKFLSDKYNRLDDVVELGKYWGESINIIKYMTNADLEDFLSRLFGLNESDNEYWGKSAVNISVIILDIIEAIGKVIDVSKEIDTKVDFENEINNFNEYAYPIKKTLYSLSLVTSSIDSLKDFINNLDRFHEYIVSIFVNELKMDKKLSKSKLFNKYKKLVYNLENLKEIIEKSKKKFEGFGNSSSSNMSKTFQTIILSISTPLMGIANKQMLNIDKFDIIESLENGKILVINTQAFSEELIASFSSSIFKELTKRTIRKNLQPISIFIDEAQRVISKSFELPIDVFREAKVELFLSFQNSELMIDKIGENRFSSLLQNLGDRFIYKNMGYFNEYNTSVLENFEYILDKKEYSKVQKAKPLFLEDKELFKVELKYQKKLELHESFDLNKEDKDKVILHNENELSKLKLTLLDQEGNYSIQSFFNQRILNNAKYSLYELVNNIKENVYEDIEEDILDMFSKKLAGLRNSLEQETS